MPDGSPWRDGAAWVTAELVGTGSGGAVRPRLYFVRGAGAGSFGIGDETCGLEYVLLDVLFYGTKAIVPFRDATPSQPIPEAFAEGFTFACSGDERGNLSTQRAKKVLEANSGLRL